MSLKNIVFSAAGSSSTPIEIPIVSTVDKLDPFMDNSGIALYQFNGNALDTGGVYNGTATNVTYGEGKFEQCGVFNGTSSYVSNANLFNIITRNTYTISVWHFIPNGTTGQRAIIQAQDTNNTYNPLCMISYGVTPGKYSFALRTNSSSLLDNSLVSFNTNQWAHVVLMCTTGGAKAYLNGVEVASSSFIPVFTADSTGSFNIGRVSQDWIPWIGHYCAGSIDQVRIFNRALTQEEVEVLYNEEKEVVDTQSSVDPFMDKSGIALYKLDGNALDTGGVYNGTATNVTYGEGEFGQAAVFTTNINENIQLNSKPINNTDKYSISAWVKLTTKGFFGIYVSNTIGWNQYGIEFMGGPTSIGFSHLRSDAVSTNGEVSCPQRDDGIWHHYVATRNGLSIKLYEDGILVSSANLVHNTTDNYANAYVGQYINGNTNTPQVTKSIDHLRLFSREITAEEVTALFEEKTFLPELPLNNLLAYYPLDNGAGSLVGDFKGDSYATTYIGKRAYFNGTSSKVSITPNPFIPLDLNNIAISFFGEFATTGAEVSFINSYKNANSEGFSIFRTSTNYLQFKIRNGGTDYTVNSNATVTSGVLYHITGVVTSGVMKLFINGVKQTGTASTTFTNDISGALGFGHRTTDFAQKLTGYMDQLVIYNRSISDDEVFNIYSLGLQNLETNITPPVETDMVSYFPFSKDANDIEGTNDGTSTSVVYDGESAYLNGATARINLESLMGVINSATKIYSVSFFVQQATTYSDSAIHQIFCAFSTTSPFPGPTLWIENNKLRFRMEGNTYAADKEQTLVLNGFHHVAIISDATTVKVYIDSSLQFSIPFSSVLEVNAVGFGANASGIQRWQGNIAHARIYNRVLTTQEVSELYLYGRRKLEYEGDFSSDKEIANFPLAVDSGELRGNYTGTATSVVFNEDYATFTSSYITASYIPTSIYSGSLWVNTTSNTFTDYILSNYSTDTTGGGLKLEEGNVKMEWGGGGGFIRTTSLTSKKVNDGLWHHIYFFANGTTAKIYVDGTLYVNENRTIYNGSTNLQIGKRGDIAQYYVGKMSNLRLFNGELTQEEVTKLYNYGRGE